MKEIEELQGEIEKIKQRNKRVEQDKAWETSWGRRIFITVSTYIFVVIFLISNGVDKPLFSAIVPAVAYIISTTSLTFIKSIWINNQAK